MKAVQYFIESIILVSVSVIMLVCLGSCKSSKTIENVVWKDSLSVRTDTVVKANVVTEKVTEYVDRWNDRYVVVTTAGDTIKDYREKIVYKEKGSYLRDSVALYKAKCDSLANIARKSQREIKTKPPELKEELKVGAIGFVLGVALVLYLTRNRRV